VQQLRSATGRDPFLAPVKTRTSRRFVELPQVTAEALARHLELYPTKSVLVADDTNSRHPTTGPAQLLFTNGRGRPISRSVWSKAWAPAAKAVGPPAGTGFHALRHYFATLLIYAGGERQDGPAGSRPRLADDHVGHLGGPVARPGRPHEDPGRSGFRHPRLQH
jgi:integrase